MRCPFSVKGLAMATLLACLALPISPANAAGFVPAEKDKVAWVQQTVQQILLYRKAEKATYTLVGFEQFLGRKLSQKEKRIYRVYDRFIDLTLTPEEDAAMQRNKQLGNWSMIMGIAGFVVTFIPYVSILTLALWPAALITGIIAVSRARAFNNRKGSGFGSGLAGIITGGLGLIFFLIVLMVLVTLI